MKNKETSSYLYDQNEDYQSLVVIKIINLNLIFIYYFPPLPWKGINIDIYYNLNFIRIIIRSKVLNRLNIKWDHWYCLTTPRTVLRSHIRFMELIKPLVKWFTSCIVISVKIFLNYLRSTRSTRPHILPSKDKAKEAFPIMLEGIWPPHYWQIALMNNVNLTILPPNNQA